MDISEKKPGDAVAEPRKRTLLFSEAVNPPPVPPPPGGAALPPPGGAALPPPGGAALPPPGGAAPPGGKPAAGDPRVGQILQGRYKILAPIASGGMGAVYRGERLQLGRAVAIKFLHPWVAAQPSFVERFNVEARAMSRLNHPNCASVMDFGVEKDAPYIVMDFVGGRSLRALMDTERLAPGRALALMRQILAGVSHAHAQGIVHRDLKPENIFVSDAPGLNDHVRILDFGLAKLRDGPALTAGMAIGTPSYMAPEQTLGTGTIDARADVYAMGVLLFEMLTGRKPFRSENIAELIVMHQQAAPPSLSSVAPEASFSATLENVIATALAKSPGDRHQNADAMLAALDATAEGQLLRPGVAALGAAPTALPRPAGDEMTTVDRPPDFTLAERPAPAAANGPTWWRFWRASLWKDRRWQLWRGWSRRDWIMRGGYVAAVLLVLTGLLLWRSLRGSNEQTAVAPGAAPAGAGMPAGASDDLAPAVPETVPGAEQVVHLLRSGMPEQASAAAQELKRAYPRSPYVNFLLAVAYFERRFWSDGMQAAQVAFQGSPAYRASPRLIQELVRSLVSDRFWERAGSVLTTEMQGATPFLQAAANGDESPKVRARAAQILAGNFAPGSGTYSGRSSGDRGSRGSSGSSQSSGSGFGRR